MLKIGDMSRAAQVTVKTLRHYDRLGLLKPAWVDRFTGYRYYRLEQLARLHRIIALKDLGLSLKEIGQVLSQDGDPSALDALLRAKADAVREEIRRDSMRLTRIEGRIASLNETHWQDHAVVLKAVPAQWVLGWHTWVPDYAAAQDALVELPTMAWSVWDLRQGPPMVIFADQEPDKGGLDIEMAFPVLSKHRPRLAEVSDGVVRLLPDHAQVACALCPDLATASGEVHIALTQWVERSGYRRIGAIRQVCLPSSAGAEGPATDMTELQYPVEHIRSSRRPSMKEPKIETQEAFAVVGMLYHGKNENHEIPAMWGRYVPRIGEIRHICSDASFGVCSAMDADGAFDYVAGVAVSSSEDVPEGMVYRVVPAGTYAAFECTLPTIGAAYDYAFKTWLPASTEWAHEASRPDYELYPGDYDPNNPASPMYIYVPVKQK